MAAARNGDFDRLLRLLAPDAAVSADDAAVLVGTPRQIQGRDEVATFFNDGLVRAITFRATPDVLSRVVRRDGGRPRR